MYWPAGIIQDPIEGDEEWKVEEVEDYKVWAIKRPLDVWDDKWQAAPPPPTPPPPPPHSWPHATLHTGRLEILRNQPNRMSHK